MAKIKIKQLEERTATAGLFMGNTDNLQGAFRRKLEPGEIIEVPDDEMLPDGRRLIEALLETGSIDLVPDSVAVTRPLDYANRREAMLCSPSFNPSGPDEEKEMKDARARVEARLLEQSSNSLPDAESPEDDDSEMEPLDEPDPPPRAADVRARSRRGARPRADSHGEAATT